MSAARPSPATSEAQYELRVMIVDGDSERSHAAVKAGGSAYVVDGLAPERIRSILEVACARFEAHQELAGRLKESERLLAERKHVEKAKGLLMQKRGLSEDEAFKELRGLAMGTGKTLSEVAQTLIAASHLL